jgi:hypothetical protein
MVTTVPPAHERSRAVMACMTASPFRGLSDCADTSGPKLKPSCDASTSLNHDSVRVLARGVDGTPHRRNVVRVALIVRAFGSRRSTVQTTREEVVRILRRAGLFEDAEWAEVSLPETADFEEVLRAGAPRGITRDTLVSLLGGEY